MSDLPRNVYSCGACRTRESETWWKAPKGLASNVLCDNCGISWRKYADLNVRPFREETISKKTEKREGTPMNGNSTKRARVSRRPTAGVTARSPATVQGNTNASQTSAAASVPPAIPQFRCMACHKNGPATTVLRCKKCQFRVHPGVFLNGIFYDRLLISLGECGIIADESTFESWTCELCANENNLEAALVRAYWQ